MARDPGPRLFGVLTRCRLCWRVTLAVFASVLAAELIVLVPSYHKHRSDLLATMEQSGRTAVTAVLRALDLSEAGLGAASTLIAADSRIRALAYFRPDGTPVGTAGRTLDPDFAAVRARVGHGRVSDDGARYEVAWSPAQLGVPYWVLAHLDSSDLSNALRDFLLRIGGLVLLISLVVCGVAMLILGRSVLLPLLAIRDTLDRAMADPANADLHAVAADRDDEIGEVMAAVNALLDRVSRTHREDLATMLAMVDHSAEATIAYDGTRRLVYANRACLALCGYDDTAAMTADGVPRFRLEEGGRPLHLVDLVGADGFSGEAQLVRAERAPVPCWVGAARLEDQAGTLIRYYATITDVSEMRQAQERLERQNIELAASNRAKSEFLANMSHELRTPLNAIIGFAEIMQNEMLGGLGNPHYREYTRDIGDSGRHLLQMINDILDLAKIEAGKLELGEEECDVGDVIRGSARLLRERARSHGIGLHERVPRDLPLLWADGRKLKQILINLLSNAVKFTPDGGRVTITGRADEEGLAIVIADTGIGIPPDRIESIFEPFVQVESGLSRRYDGTGLGLPLTRAMVELHGGRIDIESLTGEGTTVTVRLPAERLRAHGRGRDEASLRRAASA